MRTACVCEGRLQYTDRVRIWESGEISHADAIRLNFGISNMLSHVIYIFLEFKAQYNLSVESNQNVESKRQSVETKMGKWGVQLC